MRLGKRFYWDFGRTETLFEIAIIILASYKLIIPVAWKSRLKTNAD